MANLAVLRESLDLLEWDECAVGARASIRSSRSIYSKPLCSSLSSIHILYNQAIVGGIWLLLSPARWIANFQLVGGSM